MTQTEAGALLRAMFDAAVASADPARVLSAYLPEKPLGRCIVVGAGKSAAAMAQALEAAWPDVELSGVVVTPYGHHAPTRHITVREASHPVPDQAGLDAAQEVMDVARAAGPDDLVLALISGGGSALLPMPVPPLTLQDEAAVNRALLRSGLAIDDMNRIRRRISLIKGGGLARAAAPARVVTLAISDVPGDDPAAIASGPTVPDPTAHQDLTALLAKLPDVPKPAQDIIARTHDEAPLENVDFRLIAAPFSALEAAAGVAREHGVTPLILGDALEGEARELGTAMAGIASSVAQHGQPVKRPAVLLSGGETTVTIGKTKPGRGGRNTEFLLALGVALNGQDGIHAIACDTDGIDGTEDAAGAIIGPDFLERCNTANADPKGRLAAHDSYGLFEEINGLVVTGPTCTNVNDFRAVLIL